MIRRGWVSGFVVSIAVMAALPLAAQQATFEDALLDHFVGRWVLTGSIHGTPTTHDVTAAWVLNHQYLRIEEVSREKNGKGEPAYQATVFVGWDAKAGQYVCVWLDVYGGISGESLGHAARKGDSIPFVFRGAGGVDTFHNTFSYDRRADRWTWKMDNVDKGVEKPFALLTLTRR